MVPKRTNSRCSVFINRTENWCRKIHNAHSIHHLLVFIVCALFRSRHKLCARVQQPSYFGDLHQMNEKKKCEKQFLHMHSPFCVLSFFMHDEVGVLLPFCGVIVCDIFHKYQSQHFRTAEPTTSSQKMAKFIWKKKSEIANWWRKWKPFGWTKWWNWRKETLNYAV